MNSAPDLNRSSQIHAFNLTVFLLANRKLSAHCIQKRKSEGEEAVARIFVFISLHRLLIFLPNILGGALKRYLWIIEQAYYE